MTARLSAKELVARQREFFALGETRYVDFRMRALDRLDKAVRLLERELLEALKQDLGKHEFEAFASEVGMTYGELRYAIKRVAQWAKAKRVATPLAYWPSSSHIYPEPLGTILIISPWNYPLNLALIPLIGAIAAGNTAIIKTSEFAPATSKVVKKLIEDTFDPGFCAVVEGAVAETTELLQERFDHIFFTGSTTVGRIIMRAAAENLTPVTLELGGKSPCIVDASANLDVTAKRIVWGKFFNAGQTCVAPDYLMVDASVKEALLAKMKGWVSRFYGSEPAISPDFARIINRSHFDRLVAMLREGEIVVGGHSDAERLYIAPTIIDHVSPSAKVMEEEIFGPILPVLEYTSFEEAISFVKARPKPLAGYLFANDPIKENRFIHHLPFGGGCINDALVHFANPNLPFGGVGDSGVGAYHGRKTFDVFTHRKSVVKTPFRFDLPIRYPKYKQKLRIARRFLG